MLCSGDLDYCVDAQKVILFIWKLCVGVKEHVHMVQCYTMCSFVDNMLGEGNIVQSEKLHPHCILMSVIHAGIAVR